MTPSREKINRREQIIEAAGELFQEQGYSATSIRRIADQVGCTEAALYYHFESKRDLLQAVLTAKMPNFSSAIEELETATSLRELVYRYGKLIQVLGAKRMSKMRWIAAEFHRFSEEEREIIHCKYESYHVSMTKLVHRFVPDYERASDLAWLIICTGFGYGQLYYNLGIKDIYAFSPDRMVDTLVSLMPDEVG
jgi:AcrR family transcriptional regulator